MKYLTLNFYEDWTKTKNNLGVAILGVKIFPNPLFGSNSLLKSVRNCYQKEDWKKFWHPKLRFQNFFHFWSNLHKNLKLGTSNTLLKLLRARFLFLASFSTKFFFRARPTALKISGTFSLCVSTLKGAHRVKPMVNSSWPKIASFWYFLLKILTMTLLSVLSKILEGLSYMTILEAGQPQLNIAKIGQISCRNFCRRGAEISAKNFYYFFTPKIFFKSQLQKLTPVALWTYRIDFKNSSLHSSVTWS